MWKPFERQIGCRDPKINIRNKHTQGSLQRIDISLFFLWEHNFMLTFLLLPNLIHRRRLIKIPLPPPVLRSAPPTLRKCYHLGFLASRVLGCSVMSTLKPHGL